MIEKFKTNAEVIENGDKYLYGNHVRMFYHLMPTLGCAVPIVVPVPSSVKAS